ncbi:MAG: L-aspartate oxidase [Agathobacter sp.]|nr:L-aspartate oxidase [Agathobacter sp.]
MKRTDVLIVGTGCSGLYCALQLPKDMQILMISKSDLESSDSFLAQGGMCTLRSDDDFESFFQDTLKAGHYENDRESVKIMIQSSKAVVEDLLSYGTEFDRDEEGNLLYTREGAHSNNRILFHEDITGKEITSSLLGKVRERSNITLMEYTTMIDILEKDNRCFGAVLRNEDGSVEPVLAKTTVWACGGVGGLFPHSTNFKHLTGDTLALAQKHGVALRNPDYVQIHPTTLYQKDSKERSFLISESVRGEGAKLYDKNGNRFVDELLPRDLLTKAILEQMEKDKTDYVWEDLRTIPKEELLRHFPNIVEHCKEMGYDVTKECIPVVPAQHYYMGGIKVNYSSRTTMEALYAVGEAACNGVHGRNRLASNSLLESLVFAKRAAKDIEKKQICQYLPEEEVHELMLPMEEYLQGEKLEQEYREIALNALGQNGKSRSKVEKISFHHVNLGKVDSRKIG